MITAAALQWMGDALQLHGRPVVRIVPDAARAGMWRVELPDGGLSDLANRVWAKEAALAIACRLLNQRADKAA